MGALLGMGSTVIAWVVAVALVAGPSAHGAPRVAAPRVAHKVVMIAVASQREASFRALQAVRGQLSDVAVALEVHPVDRLDPSAEEQLRTARAVAHFKKASVVFWFDSQRARVSIYLRAPGGGRLLERPVRSAGVEGRYEALAVIVRFAVRGLLQGEKVGVRLSPVVPRRAKRTQAPPPLATTPPPVARPALGLAMEVGYDMDLFSDQVAAAQGLRVALVGTFGQQRRWEVLVGFRMEAPLDAQTDTVALSLRRFPINLGGRFLWRRGRVLLGAQLALTVAVLTARWSVLEGGEEEHNLSLHAAVSLSPSLLVGLHLIPRLSLLLGLGVRVGLNRWEYRARVEPDRLLLSPWRVQPALSLSLRVEIH